MPSITGEVWGSDLLVDCVLLENTQSMACVLIAPQARLQDQARKLCLNVVPLALQGQQDL